MKTKRWRKVLGCLLASLLLAALLPTAAMARGVINTTEPVSLTIQDACRGLAYGESALTGDFQDDPVTLKQPDQAGWRVLAATLDGYAARDQRKPLATRETDADGQLTFSGLEAGMYLVTWQKHTTGGYTYTPVPFLVSLPGLDGEDNWVYDVTADPKYDREKVPVQPGAVIVDRKVLKVWEDDGAEDARPESITVQLLQNGKVYDTVTLSGKNRWSYAWDGLSKDDTWQVVEADVPEEYTVTVSREGITFVVTNTLTEEIPDEPVPQGPALPQTGVLWWPVPLLACAGMALFLAGWARRRSEECDEA